MLLGMELRMLQRLGGTVSGPTGGCQSPVFDAPAVERCLVRAIGFDLGGGLDRASGSDAQFSQVLKLYPLRDCRLSWD